MKSTVALLVLTAILSGCGSIVRSTRKDIVKTGLFKNDPQKLLAAYQQVKDGQTLEEVASLGFKLDSPNVRQAVGVDAIKMMLGDNVFQSAMSSIMQNPESLRKALAELSPYKLYIIPYQNITTVSDRFYINRQDTKRDGKNYQLFIAFKDDKVVYRSNSLLEIQESTSEDAFMKGLFDLLKEIAGVKGSVTELEPLIPKRNK